MFTAVLFFFYQVYELQAGFRGATVGLDPVSYHKSLLGPDPEQRAGLCEYLRAGLETAQLGRFPHSVEEYASQAACRQFFRRQGIVGEDRGTIAVTAQSEHQVLQLGTLVEILAYDAHLIGKVAAPEPFPATLSLFFIALAHKQEEFIVVLVPAPEAAALQLPAATSLGRQLQDVAGVGEYEPQRKEAGFV